MNCQFEMRVGKPLFCEALRLACEWERRMYTPSSRGSKRKADKNVDADFTSCLALREGKPLLATKGQKPDKRISEYSTLVTLVSLVGFQHRQQQYNTESGASSASPSGLLSVVCNASHLPQAVSLRHKPPRLQQQRRA